MPELQYMLRDRLGNDTRPEKADFHLETSCFAAFGA
jgi:hypothetical protein